MTSHSYIRKLAAESTPLYRYDPNEDFYSWQKRAKQKLEELLGLPLIKPKSDHFTIKEQEIKEGIEYIHFSFESEDGYEVVVLSSANAVPEMKFKIVEWWTSLSE